VSCYNLHLAALLQRGSRWKCGSYGGDWICRTVNSVADALWATSRDRPDNHGFPAIWQAPRRRGAQSDRVRDRHSIPQPRSRRNPALSGSCRDDPQTAHPDGLGGLWIRGSDSQIGSERLANCVLLVGAHTGTFCPGDSLKPPGPGLGRRPKRSENWMRGAVAWQPALG